MDDTEKNDLLKTIFDVMPSMVFVVDKDVRVQEYNSAASDLIMSERNIVLKQRAGDILHCIHSKDVAEGCGRAPYCEKCIIRNSVADAFQGSRTVRRRTKLELIRDEQNVLIYALITVSPFIFHEALFALLVIEDISEIAELQRLIPICVSCRQVRDDNETWMRVETYFKGNWDVDFTHGLCPACFKVEMDKINGLMTGQDIPATENPEIE